MDYQYEKEETFILFNQYDPDLGGKNGEFAIKVQLPTVESYFSEYNKPWEELIKMIPGYGIDPKKQKFDYYRDKLEMFKVPDKIIQVIDSVTEEVNKKNKASKEMIHASVEQIWEVLESNPSEYEAEFYWMKLQIKRWVQGTWFFIKGKPTYFDGDYYMYLVFNPIMNRKREDGKPFYKDVDRRTAIGFKWCETTKESMYRYQVTGRHKGLIKTMYFNNKKAALRYAKRTFESGYYELDEGYFLVEGERRSVAGIVWSTRRGGGKTYWGSFKGIMRTLRSRNEKFGIQARSGETAKSDVYQDKVRTPFQELPFFLKPSNQVYESSINLFPKVRGEMGSSMRPNGGKIFTRTSEMTNIDGNRLYTYLNDESGKNKDGDVVTDHMGTIRETLHVAGEIIGFGMYLSTFGEFEGGGKKFFDLFKLSMWHKQTDIGRTQTWLISIFTPAFDGFDICVDEYGLSVIEDPEEPYINMHGVKMEVGAKTYQMAEREAAKQDGDWELYNSLVRNNPWNIREASRPVINSEAYDMDALNKRIEYLQFDAEAPQGRDVNLGWVGGKMFKEKVIDGKNVRTNELADVEILDPEQGETGRFKMYIQPQSPNKKEKNFDDNWMPTPGFRNRFVLGTDPFAYDDKDTRSKQLSKGGGAMFMKRDLSLDTNEVPRNMWETHKTAMTYLHRATTTDEFAEDMLKAAVLYNSMVCTETNVTVVLKKFREWKCWGYILYTTDPVTGILNTYPGVRTQGEAKNRLLSSVRDYVKYDIQREDSLELCEQILATETPEDLTKNDLVAALGVALIGIESTHVEIMDDYSTVLDMSDETTYD
jgi:hypothetical protein